MEDSENSVATMLNDAVEVLHEDAQTLAKVEAENKALRGALSDVSKMLLDVLHTQAQLITSIESEMERLNLCAS